MIEDQYIRAMNGAGASSMYEMYVRAYPESRAAHRVKKEVDQGNPEAIKGGGHFLTALWDGDFSKMAMYWDSLNKARCVRLFGGDKFGLSEEEVEEIDFSLLE